MHCHGGVPTPKIGHWAKLQAGKKVPQIALPEFDPKNHVATYTITFEKKEGLVPDNEIIEFLKPLGNVAVPDKIKSMYPLVAQANERYSVVSPDRMYGAIGGYFGYLNIRISKKQLERTLRILDTICKALDRLHLKVENEKDKVGTFVSIHGQQVHFLIEERFRQVDHILTTEEKIEQKKNSYFSSQKFDYLPTGELSIRIDDYCDGCRKKWRDGKKSIEDQVGDFLKGMIVAAAAMKKHSMELEDQSRRWRETREREQAERQRRIEEQKRFGELEQQADNLNRSKKIRAYVGYVKEELAQQTNIAEELNAFSVWENGHLITLNHSKKSQISSVRYR